MACCRQYQFKYHRGEGLSEALLDRTTALSDRIREMLQSRGEEPTLGADGAPHLRQHRAIEGRGGPNDKPETSEYAVPPLPVVPRLEPEVQQQLGEPVQQDESDREAKEMALAGIYAALRMNAITAKLCEQLQQCLRILAQP
jgi:hypothetical protein